VPDDGGAPLLIDCNPRMVEPFNAYRSGVDLVRLLLLISLGATPAALPEGREGVLTHLALQALLGCAARGGTRRDIARECVRLLASAGLMPAAPKNSRRYDQTGSARCRLR
jgi:hypothetical protein